MPTRVVEEYDMVMQDMLDHNETFGPLNNGTRKYRDSDLYLIFAKKDIPCIIPKKIWKTSPCYIKKLCTYVMASGEAFMVWMFTNYNKWWLKKYYNPEVKGENKDSMVKRKKTKRRIRWACHYGQVEGKV